MCGRFANQEENQGAWDAYFDAPMPSSVREEVTLGYNIAPTQMIPVVTEAGWLAARWGMVGPWVKSAEDVSSKFATFNARSETIAEKATFRGAWCAGRRCIIPALGYYEWKKGTDGKQPYFAQTKNDEPLFFGGLYEYARGDIPASCTIITLPANKALAPLHHRMPVMFATPQDWLQKGTFEHAIASLQWHPVAIEVNSTRNQGEHLILPI